MRTLSAKRMLGLVFIAVVAATVRAQPNIVLFVVDDMGWADWEARSDFYETPNMTRLAIQGTRFTQGYAAASICSPTRASLMTGMSPAQHGMTKWIPGNPANRQTHPNEPLSNFQLDGSLTTVAEVLQQENYATAHMGKWHLGESGSAAADPLNHGFDTNIGGNTSGAPSSYTNRSTYINLPNLDSSIQENFLTDHLAQEAQNYIEARADANEAFFLNFDLYAVHTPIQSHPDYINHFQTKPDGTIHDNANYASMLAGMDAALGQILDTLDAKGIADETVVIFTSDHGGLTSPSVTSNAPLRGGKGQQWEGGHRVPLIVSGPGVQSGVTTDYQAISHDLYPTILDIASASGDPVHNAKVEGLSLKNVLSGANTQDRGESLFWHFPHTSNHNGGPYGAVVNGDWKFSENYETGEQFLYDLSNDLGESNNLINADPAQALVLRQELHDYLRDTEASLWGGNFALLGEECQVDCTPPVGNYTGQSISVNFHADDISSPADHQLSAGELAGLNPVDTWNNVSVGSPGANGPSETFAPTSLSDSEGNAAAAQISVSPNSTWFAGYAASSAGNGSELNLGGNEDDLFNSYLALNGPNGDGSPADSAVITVSGLGTEFTENGYQLVIYSDSDRGSSSTADRTSVFTLTAADGTTIVRLIEDDGSLGGTFSGNYIESDNVDSGAAYSNFTVFGGLTTESFTLEITSPGGGGRGAISGFQIIAAGSLACDFNGDGYCNLTDIDELFANFGGPATYDMNQDGTVDGDDISAWLTAASAPENPYLGGAETFVLGDLDLNGEVDSTDLGLLLNNFNNSGILSYSGGNLNVETGVNSTDLGLLLNNFGFATAGTAVPEPSAWALLLISMACLLRPYLFSRRR